MQFLAIQSGGKVYPCANEKDTEELHWEVSWAPDARLHSFSRYAMSFAFIDHTL